MSSKDKALDFSGQTIYTGLDVHKHSWEATICTAHTVQKTLRIERPFADNLACYLQRHYPEATYQCAYEAGFSGFWAHEQLQARGIETYVVHPADVPTTDKERQFKDDRGDSRKLALSLRSGELEGIYVPTRQAQQDRSVVRERERLAKCQRRVKQQIKSHLHFYGITIPDDLAQRYWSRRFVRWLEQIRDQHQDEALALQLDRHLRLRHLQLQTMRQLRGLARHPRYAELSELLRSIPGMGLLSALIWITEIVDMRRFRREDQLLAYVGLIPTQNCSGERQQTGEMTRRGNARLKKALIESSWVAIRHDAELLLRYEQFCQTKGKHKAIVKVARLLLRRIRGVWLRKEKYRVAQV